MDQQIIDAVDRYTARADRSLVIEQHRRDQLQAWLRDTADAAGINLGDPDEARVFVTVLMTVAAFSGRLHQFAPARWSGVDHATGLVPLRIAAALVRPYIAGGA